MQKPLFNAPIPTQQASLASPVASAIGNMGSAVKKVGKITAQLQQEQERQILAEAELKMKKSSYELKDKLTNEHDPSKHVEIAQLHFDKLQGTILNNDKLTPGFQNDLGDRLKMFTESKLMSIESDAKLQQVDNGRKLQVARIEMYQKEGDFEQAEAALNEGVGVYWGKEHAEIGKMKLKTARENAELSINVTEDPKGALEALRAKDEDGNYTQYTHLNKYDRMMAQNKADRVINGYRKAEISELESKVDAGTITTAEIEAFNGEHITDKDKQEMIKGMVRYKPPTAEEFTKASGLIDDFIDFSKGANEGELMKRYMDLERQIKALYPKGSENQLLERLKEYSPYEQIKTKRGGLNGKAQTWITKSKELSPDLFGEIDSVDSSVNEKGLRERIYNYIKENPDATWEDVQSQLIQELDVRTSVDLLNSSRSQFGRGSELINSVNQSAYEMMYGGSWYKGQ